MIRIDQVINAAKKYQEFLFLYFKSNTMNQVILDLKKILKSKDDSHYGLQIVEGLDNIIKIELLNELMYTQLYDNPSDSHLAKGIILSISHKKLFPLIESKVWHYAVEASEDEYIITQLAQLIYEMNYTSLLNKYIKKYHDVLKNSDFI